MGVMASAIQMVENVMGKLVQSLLMPKVAPDWYAGTRRLTQFPEAPEESLLLLGHVSIEVADVEAAMRFFTEALDCKEGPEVDGAKVVLLGASQIRLVPASAERKDTPSAAAWPGQFYLWVEDSKKALAACQKLETSIGGALVQEVFHLKEDASADVILLLDPSGQNNFAVNQAPIGGMSKTMRSVLPGTDKVSNALALIGATYPIPEGKAGAVVRFYSHFLSGAMTKSKQGYALNFSLGKALHQTLTFVEEEDVQMPGDTPSGEKLPEVCLYVLSLAQLKQVFDKCAEAGILEGASTWEEVEKSSELCFSRCPDPASEPRETVLELRHRIRAPSHSQWPLPRDMTTRASEVATITAPESQ
ncbi:unnamed protein product [Symbiodinium natans]|uniref:Glyoxalase/fosfomycin resistance/dioxygenase domain-containing protein n=1 Tax=Symbiodinium natans TaxID=878477 RepID=A0A812ICW3_9DINO|nr:unnamed protein product [Symbiodinium natans]